MNLTLAQFRLVQAVARTASFTAAAEQMRISQPALSRAVKDVERIVGVRLFDRTTRSVALTAGGREFLAVVDDIVRTTEQGLGRFRAYRDGHRGVVTVAALPALAACVMPFACRRLAAERPGIAVRVLELDATDILDHVGDGRADLAVTEAPPGARGGFDVRPIGDDEMVAVVPERHRLAGSATIPWAAWACHPVVAFTAGSTLRRRADQACRQAGTEPPIAYETGSPATAVAMVAAGLGVAAMPRSAALLAQQASVVVTPLVEPVLTQPLAVVSRTVPALSAAAVAMLGVLTDVRFDPLHGRAPELPAR